MEQLETHAAELVARIDMMRLRYGTRPPWSWLARAGLSRTGYRRALEVLEVSGADGLAAYARVLARRIQEAVDHFELAVSQVPRPHWPNLRWKSRAR